MRLEALRLTQRTERELRNSGFVTAGQVASRRAEELKVFCYLTPAMLSEIEEALNRLGLALRVE
jgi:DNA-directed RNA polymerase alpha subunit